MGTKANQKALPGMESRDIPELEQAADAYVKVRDEQCALSKKESEAKVTLIQLMEMKGRSYYSYNGMIIQLSNKQNVKVNSKDEDEEEPIRASRQRSRQHQVINTSPASEFIEECDAEEEESLAAAAEYFKMVCACGHELELHEDNGACSAFQGADNSCDCDGFAPASQDEERERLHNDAVARWRRERPASRELPPYEAGIEDDSAGGTPFPTEYSQEELNRIGSFYCADKIAAGKPLKICYVLEQPHIITGGVCKGKDWLHINAWPILPLENVGEEGIFEYKDAPKGFTYQNMKINCGSKAKPKWWVMVGPQQKFTVDYAKAYPDDEIEAPIESEGVYVCGGCGADVETDLSTTDGLCSRCWTPDAIKDPEERAAFLAENADDFTAPRCDECKRTEGGHTQECSQSSALRFDDYKAYALAHYKKNHQSYARKMELNRDPEVDAKVRAWKQQQASSSVEAEPTKSKSEKLSPVEAAIDR